MRSQTVQPVFDTMCWLGFEMNFLNQKFIPVLRQVQFTPKSVRLRFYMNKLNISHILHMLYNKGRARIFTFANLHEEVV